MSPDDPSGGIPRAAVAGARPRSSRSAALRVTVSDGRGRRARAPGLGAWLSSVAPRTARGEVAVALASDARVRALNRQYRGIDRPTDVLSFAAGPGSTRAGRVTRGVPGGRRRAGQAEPREPHLGDIVIARGLASRQARAAGHALAVELRVLALHGLLHLLGYDHDDPREAGAMARVEQRLRRRGGLAAGLIERERGA